MKWANLRINKCPMCDKDFLIGLTTRVKPGEGQILSHPCGFQISEKRYSQIVNNMVTTQLEKEVIEEQEENL